MATEYLHTNIIYNDIRISFNTECKDKNYYIFLLKKIILFKYLKYNNILDRYLYNLRKENKFSTKGLIPIQKLDDIGEAFVWYKTNEGYDFWSKHEINLSHYTRKLIQYSGI